ncbi:hypothetical protein [Haloglomus irregulare]|jgi:hypothetical protein|uniref:hypothetical protein n=1 Tax=Haloglomus irregulare TaxID=2234134 RepID=UPI001186ED4E|nr:hypothetical protein [Haloglomus irregulare]
MALNPKLTTLFVVIAVLGTVAALATGGVTGQTQAGVTAQQTTDEEQTDQPEDDGGDHASEGNETIRTVNGTLESSGGEDYRLDGLVIDIGPEWYTSNTTADTDFDGDGTTETIRSEFDGLVGEEVTLTVETDGEEGDVRAVNDHQYREQGPPPWAGGPHGNGPPDHAGGRS